jgi:hypothetical protein
MDGGTWTNAKLSIISTGDTEIGGWGSTSSCTWLEIVTTHAQDHQLRGYHSCGWYWDFNKQIPGEDNIDMQPNGTKLGAQDDASPTCWWRPDYPGSYDLQSWGHTGPDCWALNADEWHTVQVMVRIGPWQPAGTGSPLSHVTIWAAREGGPQRVVIDRDIHIRGPEESGQKYGKVWLLPFMSGKDQTEAHPTGHIWYDELIVSTSFITDPK